MERAKAKERAREQERERERESEKGERRGLEAEKERSAAEYSRFREGYVRARPSSRGAAERRNTVDLGKGYVRSQSPRCPKGRSP